MSLLIASVVLAMPCVQDAKEVTKDWKHPWAGATVGTVLKYRKTTPKSVMGPGGDMEEEGERSEWTETVTGIKGTSVYTKIIVEGDPKGRQETYYTFPPAEFSYRMTRAGEETLKVGDQTYGCIVYEFRTGPVTKSGKDDGQLRKVWRAPNTPVWAVKEQFWGDASKDPMWTQELVKTETLKAAGKEYVCAVVKKTTKLAGVEKIETTWIHPDVPGEWGVKRIEQQFTGGKEMKMFFFTAELIELVKK